VARWCTGNVHTLRTLPFEDFGFPGRQTWSCHRPAGTVQIIEMLIVTEQHSVNRADGVNRERRSSFFLEDNSGRFVLTG
jgi:hypothetical protein